MADIIAKLPQILTDSGLPVALRLRDNGDGSFSLATYQSAAGTGPADTTATGSITTQNLVANGAATANSAVLYTVPGGGDSISVQVTGTYTGALTLQATLDGSRWETLGGLPLINVLTGIGVAAIPSTTVAIYQADVAGFAQVRITGLAAMTGAAVVTIKGGVGTAAVALDSPLPAGTAAIGTVQIGNTANTTPIIATPFGGATNGLTQTALNSAATTNATSVKATAGVLHGLQANNTTAAAKFIRIYNKASAPTVGTDTPVVVVTIPASTSKEVEFGAVGKKFSTGIAFSITNAAAVLDATAVAAGDVQLALDWI